MEPNDLFDTEVEKPFSFNDFFKRVKDIFKLRTYGDILDALEAPRVAPAIINEIKKSCKNCHDACAAVIKDIKIINELDPMDKDYATRLFLAQVDLRCDYREARKARDVSVNLEYSMFSEPKGRVLALRDDLLDERFKSNEDNKNTLLSSMLFVTDQMLNHIENESKAHNIENLVKSAVSNFLRAKKRYEETMKITPSQAKQEAVRNVVAATIQGAKAQPLSPNENKMVGEEQAFVKENILG